MRTRRSRSSFWRRSRSGSARWLGPATTPGSISTPIAAVFALSSAVLYATFLTTTPESGIGIVSVFPYYLLGPLAAGFVSALVAVTWIGGDGRAGLPLAYAGTTLGVLVGADVLRQPPLYGTGGPALLSIGGAGLEDLLYLSGLLAAAAAYLLYRYVRPRPMEVPEEVLGGEAAPATPTGLLHRAQLLSGDGRTARSVRKSADAAWAAAEQARRLRGAPPGRRDRPWEGMPVSPWVVADHQNLDALAAVEPVDARDADRAWIAASGIVQAAAETSRPRYPTLLRRSAAFGIDLAITLAPAVLVWVAIIQSTPGNITNLVNSVTFNASILGYAAYAFLYLVLGEALFGTTIGKYVLALEVSDRSVRRPGPFSVLLRNIPKLVPLTVAGSPGRSSWRS